MMTTTHDNWALITGGSSGIGRALAFELAAHNFNVFLTGRNEADLAEVAAQCRQRFSVATAVHLADLSLMAETDGLVRTVIEKNLNLEILVNNAGFTVKGRFPQTDLVCELELLNVQLAAMLKLTKEVLPGMINRRRGRILNVGSVYSFVPVPFQSVYSACKSFILTFSAAIAEETKGTGVSVTVLCPGATRTQFRARAGFMQPSWLGESTAEQVARVAVDQTLRGKHLIVPGGINRTSVFLGRHLPAPLSARLMRFVNRMRGLNA